MVVCKIKIMGKLRTFKHECMYVHFKHFKFYIPPSIILLTTYYNIIILLSVNKCFISCVSLFIKEICALPQMYWLDQDDTAVSFKKVIALMTLKCEFPWVAVVTYNGGTAHPCVTIVINYGCSLLNETKVSPIERLLSWLKI